MTIKQEILGQELVSVYGKRISVVDVKDINNITVEFADGEQRQVTYTQFKCKRLAQADDRVVHGIGYLGVGPYKKYDEAGKETKVHARWRRLLTRGYSEVHANMLRVKQDMSVHPDWHCFQTFAEWDARNYYQVQRSTSVLTNNLIVRDATEFGPDTCLYIPHKLNQVLLLKRPKQHTDLPRGVQWRNGEYTAKYRHEELGTYPTIEEAYTAYKLARKAYISTLVEEYKEELPTSVYEALLRYVEQAC